jgi:hypothetical protein
MVLAYPSSTTTIETRPKPWTKPLVLSMPHHSFGLVGLGVPSHRRAFGFEPQMGVIRRLCSRLKRRARVLLTGRPSTKCR